MSFTPVGWDEKSWLDACNAQDRAAEIVGLLRVALGKEDASAGELESLFQDLQEVAGLGAMSASWCKS